jgi:hypothetical protein
VRVRTLNRKHEEEKNRKEVKGEGRREEREVTRRIGGRR